MTAFLAIETATDACSVALFRDGEYQQCHEVVPRQHNQRLFSMLSNLLPHGDLRSQGIDALAYGSGPGSFTGLRIAASAVQGLAYAADLPVVPVSTLACQAATAYRLGLVDGQRPIVSTLDARINEIYWAVFSLDGGVPRRLSGPVACPPGEMLLEQVHEEFDMIGSGCHFLQELPTGLRERVVGRHPDLLPEARDLIPLASASLKSNEYQHPLQVQPVYVRDEISWKKLSEQGPAR